MSGLLLPAELPAYGLYAITDGPRSDLFEVVEAVLSNGASMLQYRDKTTDCARRLEEAHQLAKLCTRYRKPLIINDDVALAAAVGAAGVHLGADDADVATAREQLGADAIIGVSCYNSLERAKALANQGVNYLAFGSFFDSPTKSNAVRATPDLLEDAKSLNLPLVAIGGITPENGGVLIKAGASFLAVISGVFAQDNPGQAAQNYVNLFRNL